MKVEDMGNMIKGLVGRKGERVNESGIRKIEGMIFGMGFLKGGDGGNRSGGKKIGSGKRIWRREGWKVVGWK